MPFEQSAEMQREEHDHEIYSKRSFYTPFATQFEYSGDNPIYIGLAQPGAATSDNVWQIRKLTFDGSGNVTVIQYANGNSSFSNIWDNRGSLSYS